MLQAQDTATNKTRPVFMLGDTGGKTKKQVEMQYVMKTSG